MRWFADDPEKRLDEAGRFRLTRLPRNELEGVVWGAVIGLIISTTAGALVWVI